MNATDGSDKFGEMGRLTAKGTSNNLLCVCGSDAFVLVVGFHLNHLVGEEHEHKRLLHVAAAVTPNRLTTCSGLPRLQLHVRKRSLCLFMRPEQIDAISENGVMRFARRPRTRGESPQSKLQPSRAVQSMERVERRSMHGMQVAVGCTICGRDTDDSGSARIVRLSKRKVRGCR